MAGQYFLIFWLIFLAGFLVFAPNIQAQELQLPKKDALSLLGATQQVLIDEWIILTGSGSFAQPEKQAALFLIRNAIQKRQFSYGFIEAPKDLLKAAVELAASLLLAPEKAAAVILDKIEQETVERAVDYAADWLLKNEVKIAKGSLPYSFTSYKGNLQEPPLHYLIAYQGGRTGRTEAEAALEFYSPEAVEPKRPKKAAVLGLGNTVWEFNEWQRDGNEVLPPFIIRIKGKVRKNDLSYQWLDRTIEITFSETVPKPSEDNEPFIAKIPFLGDYYQDFKQRFEKIKIIIENMLKLGRLGTGTVTMPELETMTDIAFPLLQATEPATEDEHLSILPKDLRVLDIEVVEEAKTEGENGSRYIKEDRGEEISKDAASPPLVLPKLGRGGPMPEQEILAQIQEQLDDITERIDVVTQEVIGLVESAGSIASGAISGRVEQGLETSVLEAAQQKAAATEVEKIVEQPQEELGQEELGQDDIGQEEFGQETDQQKEQEERTQSADTGSSPDYYSGGAPSSSPEREEPLLFPKILITEIQITGKDSQGKELPKQDFVELYNSNEDDLNLTDWYIQRKTKEAQDFSSYAPKSLFSGKVIKAHSYFLIANASSTFSADAAATYALSENNTLVLKNPNREIVDKVGWGQTQDFETAAADNPKTGQSIGRKWSATFESYIDTDNNQQDFEFQEPSPGARNQSPASEPEPEPEPEPQNQAPTARFIFSPDAPAIGQDVLFDASSSTDPDGQIISFIWDFGDQTAFSAVQATTTHSFASSSDYLVMLYVIDNEQATSSLATTTVSVERPAEPPTEPPEPEIPTLAVVINEIAWMGTATSSSDEWIEFYNNSSSTVDITDWSIYGADTGECLNFSDADASSTTIIAPHGYLIYANDQETVNDSNGVSIVDIWDATIGMNNTSPGQLILYDAPNCQGNIVDVVNQSSGDWFAGQASPNYISMERISSTAIAASSNFANNNLITRNGKDAAKNNVNGTPKAENSVAKSQTEIGGVPDYPVLTTLGSPYIITSTLTVPQDTTLTVEPGVLLKFREAAGLNVGGSLKAVGAEDKKITFTSQNEPNYWQGIYFEPTSTSSELFWTEVKYGRRTVWAGKSWAIVVEDTSITLKNSILFYYANRGLRLVNSESVVENSEFLGRGLSNSDIGIEVQGGGPVIKNSLVKANKRGIFMQAVNYGLIEGNNFEENEKPIYLAGCWPELRANQSQNNSNIFNGIFVSGSVSADITLFKNDLPYVIGSPPGIGGSVTVNSGITLTVEPGARIELANKASLEVNGALLAGEIGQEPVVFTAYPGQAPWKNILFSEQSRGSKLRNLEISQGGHYYDYNGGAVRIEESEAELGQVRFIDNPDSIALYLKNAASALSNCHFENNKIGIKIEGDNAPAITGSSFSNNEKCDIYWPNGGESCEEFKSNSDLKVDCRCCPY